ncbi:flavin reductase family protein [Candidatus Acidianus copahuensis]|nr:flavin reductase family protein [Candidatus Acidianus copahuensis]
MANNNSNEVLKAVMRLFPNGVAIVTTKWNGMPVGMTVNTFNSLSLNPVLVMFSADKTKGNDRPFRESEAFAVNLVESVEVHDTFAKVPMAERFKRVGYVEVYGVPVLTESYAYIVLRKYTEVDIGDHAIIVGEVLEGKVTRSEPKPLVYFNRRYVRVYLNEDHSS